MVEKNNNSHYFVLVNTENEFHRHHTKVKMYVFEKVCEDHNSF